ncbi:MAG: DUF1549 domain-containing protein [Planctomycetales bacterium]|nr:DUF1549 domain-containing protein [Planctomycetales bacterium]
MIRFSIAAAVLCAALVGAAPVRTAAAAEDTATPVTSAPDYNLAQVRLINEQIAQVWKDYGMSPSPAASDGEWCRRVYLDILGRVPSVNELTAFVNDKATDKKLKLVDKLLFDEDHTEEYARNWTTLWTNILIGRSGGTGEDEMTSRAGMQKYLRDSFARNKPYDRMVQELVGATGTSLPGSDKFNGAVNFLVNKLDENGSQATAMTSQIFLGLQVQCTQCHNHPFNEWKQEKYWEMNSFFRQTVALRRFVAGTRDIRVVELANQDFAGESGDPAEADVFYDLRNQEKRVAFPVFVDGTEISKSGYLDESNRREQLAKLIVASDFLDKTMANRMWSHFLGYGFTKPIDDLGPHNPATHPQLLAELGEEFRKASFDIKELIKWITLSEAYGLSSRITPQNKADDPLLGETPKFTHFYLRQMTAEQLYESLITATRADKTRGDYEEQEKAKTEWLRQFVTAFGTDEGGEQTTFNGTIPQALMMMNGDLVKKATDGSSGSFLHTIAGSSLSPAEQVNYLAMAALGRPASRTEVSLANSLLRARMADGQKQRGQNAAADPKLAALQDLWWVYLNTNEFILVH